MKFFEDQSEADADAVIADPQPYKVEVEAGEIEAIVRNASTLAADQDEPASGAAGLLAKARGDYKRIVAALYDEGYYGGTINILVGGREAANLPPDTNFPDPVDVRIVVSSGPLFHFNRVIIVDQAPPTTDQGDFVDSPASKGFATGEIAKSAVVLRAEQLALKAWREQGHAKAEILSRDVVADHRTNTVDSTITVGPGRLAAFGPVRVQGTERMNAQFVQQQAGLTIGTEYDPDELTRAQKRIDRLEVFRSARFEAAEDIGADGLLPFNLIVQEQPQRRFGVGGTFSTVDGAGVEAFHLWRNLFGQAERLRLDARVAGIAFPVETAEFDYFFGGTFTKPGVFTPDTDLVASLGGERTNVPTYIETSASASVGFTHYLSDEITLEGGLRAKHAQFEDGFGIRDFTTAGVYGGIVFDNRDDDTNATRGFYLSGNVEPFYEFLYGNPAVRAVVEGRTYFGLGEDNNVVLAGRLKAGALLGPELSEIAPDRLFFAGGGGSVRGYAFKSIGVDENGIVSGGRYLLEASLEARVKVTDSIGVVGFVDGGYVAADTIPGIEDLKLGAGIGVRYFTGFGPLRLDVAVPLNKRDGDDDYAIYVGIGQAF